MSFRAIVTFVSPTNERISFKAPLDHFGFNNDAERLANGIIMNPDVVDYGSAMVIANSLYYSVDESYKKSCDQVLEVIFSNEDFYNITVNCYDASGELISMRKYSKSA